MKKTRTTAQLTRLKMNTGQIDWLPKNPRQWDSDDLDRTVASIIEDPDFLEDRPLLAVENGKDLVVFGGNLRLSALRKTNYKTAPVVIYEPETDEDRETIKRRAMKDNGTFGAWDWDMIANEWDNLPLQDWGVPAWHNEPVDESTVDALFEQTGEQGEKGPKVTVSIPAQYKDKVEDIIAAIRVTLDEWPGCSIK